LVSEVITVLEVLRENSVQLAGLHLESAFKEVTECIGLGVEEEHLPSKYETLCDPRLNVVQTQFLLRELGGKISG
jgi:3-deoxy-7-phosphoheptulonate synthase